MVMSKKAEQVIYKVTIALRGNGKNGEGVRYDTFLVSIDKSEDDEKHTWYDQWEGGGEDLILPNSKTAKIKHIDTDGDEDVIDDAEECWTQGFEPYEDKKETKKENN